MTHLSDPQLVEIHLIIILFCVEEVSKALNGLVDGNTDRHRSKSVTLLPTSLTIAFKFVPKNTSKIPPPPLPTPSKTEQCNYSMNSICNLNFSQAH